LKPCLPPTRELPLCAQPFKNKTSWDGTLIGRDDAHVTINLKGRAQKIPLDVIAGVSLPAPSHEPGDPIAT
jgi:ribosome maturation factor RimP